MTSDLLLFETDERGPDDRLRYQFEAISRMPMEEQELVRGLLDAVIVKRQVAGAIARAAGPAAKGKESLRQPNTACSRSNTGMAWPTAKAVVAW